MSSEQSETALTVTFQRRPRESVIAVVVALIAVQTIYFALRINAFPQSAQLVCDRGKDVCTESGHDIFGGTWSYAFPASGMRRSRLLADPKSGDPKWVVDIAPARVQELGAPTGRRAQQREYAGASAALQAFIDDPARPRFEASFASIGGPGSIGWVLLELFFAFVLVRFVYGWRTRLVIDLAASEIAIIRTPALGLPSRRSSPLTAVLAAQTSKGGMLLRSVYIPTVTFRLIGRDHRVLFARRALADRKSTAEMEADVRAVNGFLHTSGPAA